MCVQLGGSVHVRAGVFQRADGWRLNVASHLMDEVVSTTEYGTDATTSDNG